MSVNFGRPTPLKDVLAYLRQATGTQLLVDGPSLAALGLSRQSDVTLVADKRPLAEALHRLLDPLKLTVRIIDARTLQITSRNALQDRPELEFHFAADLLDKNQPADALIERVKGQLAAATWTDAGGPGVVEFDAESGCLLVLQSQDVQIRLEDLLETWRKEREQWRAAGVSRPVSQRDDRLRIGDVTGRLTPAARRKKIQGPPIFGLHIDLPCDTITP